MSSALEDAFATSSGATELADSNWFSRTMPAASMVGFGPYARSRRRNSSSPGSELLTPQASQLRVRRHRNAAPTLSQTHHRKPVAPRNIFRCASGPPSDLAVLAGTLCPMSRAAVEEISWMCIAPTTLRLSTLPGFERIAEVGLVSSRASPGARIGFIGRTQSWF